MSGHVHTFIDAAGVQRAHCIRQDCDSCNAADARQKGTTMPTVTPPVVLGHEMVRVDGAVLDGTFIPLSVLIAAGGEGGTDQASFEQTTALVRAGLADPVRPGNRIELNHAGYSYERAVIDALLADAQLRQALQEANQVRQAAWWVRLPGSEADWLAEQHPHTGFRARITLARWGDRAVKRSTATRAYVLQDGNTLRPPAELAGLPPAERQRWYDEHIPEWVPEAFEDAAQEWGWRLDRITGEHLFTEDELRVEAVTDEQ